MRVRAAGSSGVTTVNAVQTTAEGESGGGGDKRQRTKRTKGTQRGGGRAQRDKVEERDREGVGGRGVEEETGGGQTINKEHRGAAGSD